MQRMLSRLIQGTTLIVDNGASYLWDFGNGQTSTAFNPTFTYNTPGTYTVNVQTEVSELALTQVNITTLGGGWGGDVEDFFGLGAPDPYFVLSGSSGASTSDYAEEQHSHIGSVQHPLRSRNNLQHCVLRQRWCPHER